MQLSNHFVNFLFIGKKFPLAFGVGAFGNPNGEVYRTVAIWAKRHPFPASALPSPKFDRGMDAYSLRMLIRKPLQLLFCLLMVTLLSLKLCLQAA